MLTLTWVTDPAAPAVQPIQKEIQASLQALNPITKIQTVLERTITRYTYVFPKKLVNQLKVIIGKIGQINYQPATATCILRLTPTGDEILGLIELVKAFTEKLLNSPKIFNVTYEIFITAKGDKLWQFTPKLFSQERIYRPADKLYEFQNLNLNDYLGWKLLSNDGLTDYVLTQADYVGTKYRKDRGVWSVTIDTDPSDIQQSIYFLRLKGVTLINSRRVSPILLDNFGLRVIFDHGNIKGIQGTQGIYTPQWLEENTLRIQQGLYPLVLVGGPWQQKSWLPGEQGKLVLALILSYIELTREYSELIPNLTQVGVTQGLDLRILANSAKQVQQVKELFMTTLAGSERWGVFPVASVEEALAFRQYLKNSNVYLPSLLVRRDNAYFLIIASFNWGMLPVPTPEILKEMSTDFGKDLPYSIETSGLIDGYGLKGLVDYPELQPEMAQTTAIENVLQGVPRTTQTQRQQARLALPEPSIDFNLPKLDLPSKVASTSARATTLPTNIQQI